MISSHPIRSFIGIEGCQSSFLRAILDEAHELAKGGLDRIKKESPLAGMTVVNLFFETSTRTRTTFEIAAKIAGAYVVNMNINTMATRKGESLLDTLGTLQAMDVDLLIVRHHASGICHFLLRNFNQTTGIINAGDGAHEHPTQALLDVYTIRCFMPDFSKLKVAIVGDILHSRVARSQIYALSVLGVPDIRVIAPQTLLPRNIESLGVRAFYNLEEGVRDANVLIALRLQTERMKEQFIPSRSEYARFYGLDLHHLSLAAKDAIVLHPGPIIRGLEISSDLADSPQSKILFQVKCGLMIRIALMKHLLGICL